MNFMSSNKLSDTTTLVSAMVANSNRLGLTWSIRFGTVDSLQGGVTYVILDGEDVDASPQVAVPLTVQPATGTRITAFITSPTDIYIIGVDPGPGAPVMRYRRDANQSIANAGSGTFIQWDLMELDVFGLFVVNMTDWLPPVAGWYWVNGRAVWTANPTDRRAFLINTNGSTSGLGTIGGASIQAATTGSTQCGGGGICYLNGNTDFISGRAIQNSGAALTISNTDGGSHIEAVYLGSPVTT